MSNRLSLISQRCWALHAFHVTKTAVSPPIILLWSMISPHALVFPAFKKNTTTAIYSLLFFVSTFLADKTILKFAKKTQKRGKHFTPQNEGEKVHSAQLVKHIRHRAKDRSHSHPQLPGREGDHGGAPGHGVGAAAAGERQDRTPLPEGRRALRPIMLSNHASNRALGPVMLIRSLLRGLPQGLEIPISRS